MNTGATNFKAYTQKMPDLPSSGSNDGPDAVYDEFDQGRKDTGPDAVYDGFDHRRDSYSSGGYDDTYSGGGGNGAFLG